MSPRKLILTIVLMGLSIYYSWVFINSDKFQQLGDKKKVQWTCYVNNFLGGLGEVASNYQHAIDLYDHVLTRCPDKPTAEMALFGKAACLYNMGRIQDATAVYQQYLDTYPQGRKA